MQFNKHNAKKKHGTKNPNVHKQISGMWSQYRVAVIGDKLLLLLHYAFACFNLIASIVNSQNI